MAYISDLRFINGRWIDTTSPDYVFGTQDADTINVYAGDNAVSALGGNDTIFDVWAYDGGYSGADKIFAGEGNDLIVTSLDGGGNEYNGDGGTDTLNFIPSKHGVQVGLSAGTIVDLINGSRSTLSSIENVTGSAYNDVIFGSGIGNVLRGYDGIDNIYGNAGVDYLYGGRGTDGLTGGTQNDYLFGEDDGDFLYGEEGSDYLDGGAGNDMLWGGVSRDEMWGGTGRDTFGFGKLNDSGLFIGNADVVYDFERLVDQIHVRFIDADELAVGDQAFRFIGTAAAFTAAGQIRTFFDANTSSTIVLLNTDADVSSEMTIRLAGQITLTSLDFVL